MFKQDVAQLPRITAKVEWIENTGDYGSIYKFLQKKVFIFLLQINLIWSYLFTKNARKFEVAKLKGSFPIFEVHRSHFPNYEHFLVNT